MLSIDRQTNEQIVGIDSEDFPSFSRNEPLCLLLDALVVNVFFFFFIRRWNEESHGGDQSQESLTYKGPDSRQVRQVAASGNSVRDRGGVAVAPQGCTTIQQRQGKARAVAQDRIALHRCCQAWRARLIKTLGKLLTLALANWLTEDRAS